MILVIFLEGWFFLGDWCDCVVFWCWCWGMGLSG